MGNLTLWELQMIGAGALRLAAGSADSPEAVCRGSRRSEIGGKCLGNGFERAAFTKIGRRHSDEATYSLPKSGIRGIGTGIGNILHRSAGVVEELSSQKHAHPSQQAPRWRQSSPPTPPGERTGSDVK